MGLNIAICDDEKIMRNSISSILNDINMDISIKEFTNGKALINSNTFFDIILLDIEMPDLNGIETAELLRKKGYANIIIFITSHSEFMRDAFKVQTFRYLDKPIKRSELLTALNEAVNSMNNNKRIVIKCNDGLYGIYYDDIVCIEAFGAGIFIHTKNKVLCSRMTLKSIQDTLDSHDFIQVHKSFYIALKYIKVINKEDIEMEYMKNNVPLSRRNCGKLKSVYVDYINRNSKCI